MKTLRTVISGSLVVALFSLAGAAQAQAPGDPVPGRYIVVLQAGVNPAGLANRHGLVADHPDLNVVNNVSFVTGARTGADDNGHGTHVAGTAARAAIIAGAVPQAATCDSLLSIEGFTLDSDGFPEPLLNAKDL